MPIQYHQRKSLRLRNFNYSQAGAYFVTICSHNKKCIFGHIQNDCMHLTELGKLISTTWTQLTEIYSFISLDNWVVMPNHFHGIIWLNEDASGKTLSAIVAYFKALSTRHARGALRQHVCLWQRGFFEHIIRNEMDLFRIRQYIKDNPVQWAVDHENPDKATPMN